MRVTAALLLAVWISMAQDPYAARREAMVRDQMAARDVTSQEVLRIMRSVPRHLFMPESVRDLAYADHPVPIGHGQTISQPYIVAIMTQLLEPQKTHKALEIGTGSGYQAAVLSRLVRHVYSVEIVGALARSSAATLTALGYANVTVRHGDGYLGWPEQAPFDRIILTAAPPEIPQALVNQLAAGGKLVAPVGNGLFGQDLVVIDKTRDGQVRQRSIFPVRFVPMVRGKN